MIDTGGWTVRVRRADLVLEDPIEFTSARLVENYGPPDMFTVTGNLEALRPAMVTTYGCVVVDTEGRQRFSGIIDPEGFERRGDRTGTIVWVADTIEMWSRFCYPVPANDWTTAGQNAMHDIQTGTAESRLIAYVNRNLGPGARTERRLAGLHLPASGGRGPSGTSKVRFDRLGELVATLAEQANLRVRIVYNDGGWLDLLIEDAPDLTAWAKFGDASYGGPGMLGPDWSYKFGPPTASTILCAAGGEGPDRNLGKATDAAAEALWGRRVESFLDQRGTGGLPDANATLAAAIKDRAAKLRTWNTTYAALAAANANLAEHPSSTALQDAKAAAQDNHDSSITDYNDAVTAVTEATTARNTAATEDAAEIAEAMAEALVDGAGASDVGVPISNTGYELGTELPVGAKVAAELDGVLITERIRQVNTDIASTSGEQRVKTSAIYGSPDAVIQSPTQRKLADALSRLSYLERS